MMVNIYCQHKNVYFYTYLLTYLLNIDIYIGIQGISRSLIGIAIFRQYCIDIVSKLKFKK